MKLGLLAACMAWLATAACEQSLDLGRHDPGAADPSTEADGGALRSSSCPSLCDAIIACGYGEPADRNDCLTGCVSSSSDTRACLARATCETLPDCSSL